MSKANKDSSFSQNISNSYPFKGFSRPNSELNIFPHDETEFCQYPRLMNSILAHFILKKKMSDLSMFLVICSVGNKFTTTKALNLLQHSRFEKVFWFWVSIKTSNRRKIPVNELGYVRLCFKIFRRSVVKG